MRPHEPLDSWADERGGRGEIFSGKPCPTCKGTGGYVDQYVITCATCQGSGTVRKDYEPPGEPATQELAL